MNCDELTERLAVIKKFEGSRRWVIPYERSKGMLIFTDWRLAKGTGHHLKKIDGHELYVTADDELAKLLEALDEWDVPSGLIPVVIGSVNDNHAINLEKMCSFFQSSKKACPQIRTILKCDDDKNGWWRPPGRDFNQYSAISYKSPLLDKFVEMGISGILRDPNSVSEWKMRVLRTITEVEGKLFYIVAPSGYGKSSLLRLLRLNGCNLLKKLTTRHYRDETEKSSGELESISSEEFAEIEQENRLLGAHTYKGNGYAIKAEDFFSAVSGKGAFVTTGTDPISALRLARQFPSFIQVVMVSYPQDMAGMGLELRRDAVRNPSKTFKTFQEELEYLRRSELALHDTSERFEQAIREHIAFRTYLPYADIVLNDIDIERNAERLLTNIFGV